MDRLVQLRKELLAIRKELKKLSPRIKRDIFLRIYADRGKENHEVDHKVTKLLKRQQTILNYLRGMGR